MQEKFSLKDHLFNPTRTAKLSAAMLNVYPDFADKKFQAEVVEGFPALELKARIVHIRSCLRKYLPENYREAVNILLKALPEPLDENLTDNDFGDFIYAPFNDFLAAYGCNADDLDFSLSALKEVTKRFSAEDSIRYFINAFPKETLAALKEWSKDKNYHVRRLCSEGSRPKLPWSQKINIGVEEALPLLHQLHADKTRYVTRSVANHLNDIAKTHPDLVLETLKKWKKLGEQSATELNFMIKHALRTLIKNGNAEALSLLGFGDSENVELLDLAHEESVKIGEALNFSFNLKAAAAKTLMVDYIVHFQSKQGTLSNKKVHKLQQINASENSVIAVKKRHVFRANMTTRQLYEGTHKVEIQVNGTVLKSFSFELVKE